MQDNGLSSIEAFLFDSTGYVTVPSVLTPEQIERCIASVQALKDRYPPEVLSDESGPVKNAAGRYTFQNIVEEAPIFLDLLNHEAIMPKVRALMGQSVTLQLSQGLIRPQSDAPLAWWHRDGPSGEQAFDSLATPTPLMTLRVGYFLTDLLEDSMANLVVVPGSHRSAVPPPSEETIQVEDLPGSVSLHFRAGDAVLFHNAILHAVSRNTTSSERINVYYSYQYSWMRQWDSAGPSEALKATATPEQRWILGDFAKPSQAYSGRRH